MSNRIYPIPDCDGYGADKRGRIWRIEPAKTNATNKGRPLPYRIKPMTNNQNGYRYVNIYGANGSHVTRYVHKLVADTFLGPRPDNHDVDHVNTRKHDNRLVNLRYVERSKHCHKHTDARGARSGTFARKLTTHRVRKLIKEIVRDGLRPREIMEKSGLSYCTAWHLRNGLMWKHVWDEVRSNPSVQK